MAAEQAAEAVSIRTKRSFPRHTDGDASVEPLFINNIEIVQVGTDVFLDLGIVRPDDIAELEAQGPKPGVQEVELPFQVLERVVMSVNTFALVHAKISSVFEKLKGRDILADQLKNPTEQH